MGPKIFGTHCSKVIFTMTDLSRKTLIQQDYMVLTRRKRGYNAILFAIFVASMVSGSWIQYPIEQFEQMRHFLEKYGHTIDAHLTYEMNED